MRAHCGTGDYVQGTTPGRCGGGSAIILREGLMIKSVGFYFGTPIALLCDGKCSKAWGANTRESVQLSDDPDDFAYLSDSELGRAPADPGTYEGGYGKPTNKRHNKWCWRECEHSISCSSDLVNTTALPNFTQRVRNITETAQ